MEHVLWIGGPPGSGKTTIARRLARRYGMRLYSADTRTWAHRDRALDAGIEAAQRWEGLEPAARWERRGPLAKTLAERRQLLREINEAVVDQVRGYYARPWAEGDPDLVTQLLVCECGSRECEIDLRVSIGEASAAPVLAAGHS